MRWISLLFLITFASAEESERTPPPPETLQVETWRTGDVLDVNLQAAADVFLFGNEVFLEGTYAQDLWAGGRRVHYTGTASDDVRLFASEVLTVDGVVDGGSLRAISLGSLLLNTNTVVRGRTRLSAARNLTVNGLYEGDVSLSASRLIFAARVEGNLLLNSADVTFMPGSRVTGNLLIPESSDLSVPGFLVGGDIQRIPATEGAGNTPRSWVWYLRGFLVLNGFILGFLMVRFLPRFSGNAVDTLLQFQAQTLILGFLTSLFLGLAGFALTMSQLAAGAGLVLWLLLGLMTLMGHIIVALGLGALLIRHKQSLTLLRLGMGLILGLVVMQGLFALPVFGGTLWLLCSGWGLGALMHGIRSSQRVLKLEIPDHSGETTHEPTP